MEKSQDRGGCNSPVDYGRHYARLIERARGRTLSGYSERHHVLPRCMGGDDSAENIVRLTPEEHYLAHQLLVRMYPEHQGLAWAAVCMTNGSARQSGRQNKLYGWLRRRFAAHLSRAHKGKIVSAETRAKMGAARRGKKRAQHSAETREKMSVASKGRKKSATHVAALSAARLGRKFGPQSPEWRAKISASNRRSALLRDRSNQRAPEYRALQSARMKEVWRLRKAGELPKPHYGQRGG